MAEVIFVKFFQNYLLEKSVFICANTKFLHLRTVFFQGEVNSFSLKYVTKKIPNSSVLFLRILLSFKVFFVYEVIMRLISYFAGLFKQ